MSNPFGSSNHFTTANNSSTNATSYGLRQRHSSTASNVGTTRSDENANPNKSDIPTYGKWGAGAMSKVPAPPRMSLATAGKSTFPSRRSATAQQQQLPTENRSNAESNQQAVVRINEKDEEDLTLWVVGYGKKRLLIPLIIDYFTSDRVHSISKSSNNNPCLQDIATKPIFAPSTIAWKAAASSQPDVEASPALEKALLKTTMAATGWPSGTKVHCAHTRPCANMETF